MKKSTKNETQYTFSVSAKEISMTATVSESVLRAGWKKSEACVELSALLERLVLRPVAVKVTAKRGSKAFRFPEVMNQGKFPNEGKFFLVEHHRIRLISSDGYTMIWRCVGSATSILNGNILNILADDVRDGGKFRNI